MKNDEENIRVLYEMVYTSKNPPPKVKEYVLKFGNDSKLFYCNENNWFIVVEKVVYGRENRKYFYNLAKYDPQKNVVAEFNLSGDLLDNKLGGSYRFDEEKIKEFLKGLPYI